MTSPQWIRPSVNEYERLQERLSAALKSLADAEAKLADAEKHADKLAEAHRMIAHAEEFAPDSETEPFEACEHLDRVRDISMRSYKAHAARRAARDGREGTR